MRDMRLKGLVVLQVQNVKEVFATEHVNPMAHIEIKSGWLNETQLIKGFSCMFSWNWLEGRKEIERTSPLEAYLRHSLRLRQEETPAVETLFIKDNNPDSIQKDKVATDDIVNRLKILEEENTRQAARFALRGEKKEGN
jgi:hypothetical protein